MRLDLRNRIIRHGYLGEATQLRMKLYGTLSVAASDVVTFGHLFTHFSLTFG